MKLLSCAVAALLFPALATPLPAKNSVYKGTFTSTDLITGQVQVYSLYFILGDEQPLDPGKDTYALITGIPVFYGPPFGKKRYVPDAGSTFRTLEQTETVNGKPRTVEIISQVGLTFPTDTGDGEHRGQVFVLSGVHTSPKYDTPKTLSGVGLLTIGRVSSNPPSGTASRQSMKLSLVTALTDPIPTGEPLADSVKRVTDFLESRGFILFAP